MSTQVHALLAWILTVVISVLGAAPFAPVAEAAVAESKVNSAPLLVILRQYQNGQRAVSPAGSAAVSRSIDGTIMWSSFIQLAGDIQPDRTVEPVLDRPVEIEAAQYQQSGDGPRRRPMLLIGLGLGAAYLVFLAVWIWATRVRSRH
jgi:hypothetical protein